MARKFPQLLIASLVIIVLAVCAFFALRHPSSSAQPSAASATPVAPPPSPITHKEVVFRERDTLAAALVRSGLDSATVNGIIQSFKGAFDSRQFRSEAHLDLTYDGAALKQLDYRIDPAHQLKTIVTPTGFTTSVASIPSKTELVAVTGTVHSSLIQAVEDSGENVDLALRLADIFAWDLDFFTDPQPGDRFHVLVEKTTYANWPGATYGRVLAATYNNEGHRYQAFLFKGHDTSSYYDYSGKSLKAAFLHSPLKFTARISSHFSWHRYHPILRIYRPHLGTDYAAPIGSPVQAIAAGTVILSAWSGEGGNTIEIRHSNGYISYYMHLSRRLVRRGAHVDQGQRIGLVGMTGLATGPHLDFRLRQHGQFVNFEHLKIPRASAIHTADLGNFEQLRDHYLGMLNTTMNASNAPSPGGGN